jgi:hypothetical protein
VTMGATHDRRLQQLQYEIDIATTRWEKATETLEQALGGARISRRSEEADRGRRVSRGHCRLRPHGYAASRLLVFEGRPVALSSKHSGASAMSPQVRSRQPSAHRIAVSSGFLGVEL